MASVPARKSSTDTRDATAAAPSPPTLRGRIHLTQSGIAQPTKTVFDPWNTASTGHQRAENRLSGSTSWRNSRNQKLSAQYHGGFTGGRRVADSVGAGSETFGKDGRKVNGGWVKGASGLRGNGQRSIREAFAGPVIPPSHQPEFILPSHQPESIPPSHQPESIPPSHQPESIPPSHQPESIPPNHQPATLNDNQSQEETVPKKQIFENLCIYLNGTTGPLVSDHKLKYLLAQHGARMSIALGRRIVTHVILGNTYSRGGAAGGLAGTKIQKEVARMGGKGIKFVSVEWVLESIKAGKRLPEARFENLRLGGHGQGSVYSAFKASKPTSSPDFGDKR
ncbi:Cell pattern formation-associated protein [Venturia nashicola]|uniref:Cell pattern formation-associated protein n=1 Tax=Venturia nashicola TaxID=86259 RepID=A0A4Z1PH52_9PEZI|nr:Cell pattern formation-associated protein [Venturia nashicola]